VPSPNSVRRLCPSFDPRLDGSQFLPVSFDRAAGMSQEHSQFRLSYQITLELSDQSFDFGEVSWHKCAAAHFLVVTRI
jgi:hypothetical protein